MTTSKKLSIPLRPESFGPLDESLRFPSRVARVLSRVYGPSFHHVRVSEVVFLLEGEIISRGTKQSPSWKLRDGVTLAAYRAVEGRFEDLRCSQHPWSFCHHIAAVIYALLATQPPEELVPLFSQPAWQLLLDEELPVIEPPAPPKVGRHQGALGFRLELHGLRWAEQTQEAKLFDAFAVEIDLLRFSVRSGEPLKPVRAPGTWEGVRAALAAVDPQDEARFDALQAFQELRQARGAMGYSRTAQPVQQALERHARVALELAAGSGRLTWDGGPLRVDFAAPLELRFELHADGSGWLPRLVPEVLAGAVAPLPVVITADRVLHRLDEQGLRLLRLAMRGVLPKVSGAELPRFVERLGASGVQVEVPSSAQPARRPEQRVAQVLVNEVDGALVATARLLYGLEGVTCSVVPGQGGPWVELPQDGGEPRWLERELAWEQARQEELAAVFGPGQTSMFLRGVEALDLLTEGLPRLGEAWSILGEQELVRYRYVGELTPSLSFPTGTDWFELDVEFTASSGRISTRQLLKSWREGERYVVLDNGALARLPQRWLELHGEQASELLDLQRVGEGRLGAFAAPAVAALLDVMDAPPSEASRQWRALAAGLSDFEGIPSRPLPEGLQAELRTYQRRGFEWLAFLRDRGLCGCLADDMGLGKTLQALVFLADTLAAQEEHAPVLIVAPTSVLWNWAAEAARFFPHLEVFVQHGNQRAVSVSRLERYDLVVTSYALVRRDQELLREIPWACIVLDEAQNIKNPGSLLARAVRSLPAKHRLALTGTPVENHLLELWSIFHFLMPGFFGSQEGFKRRYVTPLQRAPEDTAPLAGLRRRLRPFVLRRLKREVARELPPRQEVILRCELSKAERRVYEQVRDTYRDAVLDEVQQRGVGGATIHILEALTRLRQACCHPRLLPFPEVQHVERSAKLDLLIETLETLLTDGHRALIFSQWPSLLTLARAELDARGWSYLYLDGATQHRAELVTRWADPEGPPLFLISLKAGGTGLNLTAADTVIHLDPWWNPAVEDQATDRAHRIGQQNPVTVYRLVAAETVEEKILALQQRKRDLIDAAINEERVAVEALSREDLEAVFAI